MEMSGSSFNLETEQPVQSVDIEMSDFFVDINTVCSEDGINQFSRGRPLTSSAGQGSLYNSSDAVSRGGESIPHGQNGPTSVISNRGGYAVRSDDGRPISVYPLDPQQLTALNAVHAVREHQCSPGVDGDNTTMVDADDYECKFCKVFEDYLRTAGQNNVHWDTIPF
jgi:hypothetical protein